MELYYCIPQRGKGSTYLAIAAFVHAHEPLLIIAIFETGKLQFAGTIG